MTANDANQQGDLPTSARWRAALIAVPGGVFITTGCMSLPLIALTMGYGGGWAALDTGTKLIFGLLFVAGTIFWTLQIYNLKLGRWSVFRRSLSKEAGCSITLGIAASAIGVLGLALVQIFRGCSLR